MMLAVAAAANAGAEPADPVPPAHDPNRVALAFADDDWLVWCRAELVEATRQMRAHSYLRTYSVQRVGTAETRPVLRTGGWLRHDVVAVLADGTLGMAYLDTFFWTPPPGAIPATAEPFADQRLLLEGRPQRVLRGSPRGLFIQEYALNSRQHIWFVPLKGRDLQWNRRVRVSREPVETSLPPYPQLDGDLAGAGRGVVNLVSDRRYDLGIHEGHFVRALGSGYAAGFGETVRLEDGQRAALPDDRASYVQVFAIRNGLAHALRVRGWTGTAGQEPGDDTLEVWTLDLSGARPDEKIAEAKARDLPSSFAHLGGGQQLEVGLLRVVWDCQGFWLFDGAAWRRHAWRAL